MYIRCIMSTVGPLEDSKTNEVGGGAFSMVPAGAPGWRNTHAEQRRAGQSSHYYEV